MQEKRNATENLGLGLVKKYSRLEYKANLK